MIRVLLIVAVLTTTAEAQERVTILRDKAGKVTGTIRSSGPKPSPEEGLAILCAGDRCDPRGYASLAEQEPRLIPIRVQRAAPAAKAPDSFTLHPLPPYVRTPYKQSIPLPYPTVRVVLDEPTQGKVTTR